MGDEDIRTWEAGDETTAPAAVAMLAAINNLNVPTPETVAEEI